MKKMQFFCAALAALFLCRAASATTVYSSTNDFGGVNINGNALSHLGDRRYLPTGNRQRAPEQEPIVRVAVGQRELVRPDDRIAEIPEAPASQY